MQSECDVIVEKIKALWESHRASWMEYNKPFGWEVHDLRYGGLIARFQTVKMRIGAYLSGACDRLEELEEERLRLDGVPSDESAPRFGNDFLWYQFPSLVSASRL